MTIVTAIHFARKVAHYVPTLAVNGRLITWYQGYSHV